jgi:ATP-dependent Clp protease ATP-binding subunit ClpA/ActR/RegA family two-component response regulator
MSHEHETPDGDGLVELLKSKIVGQEAAMDFIVPYVQMHKAGLGPPDRPAGVFLLLGPTGTGKTRTVEVLAEVLHGSAKSLLKIDCGEFQSDHEIARLIGAPPGYIGHRETKPMLTQERLRDATSAECDLALVLFDEIEKAAPALTTLLLGMLDKGTITLGDNSTVDFERSLIFLTSNLGAREMMREMQPRLGFQGGDALTADMTDRLESIGVSAVRRRFSPEFVNRIDAVITYQPLDEKALATIVDHHIEELQRHVFTRLGDRSFEIDVTPAARQLLLDRGSNPEYGARELKRTIHRLLTQPLAALVASGRIAPGSRVVADADGAGGVRLTPLAEPSRIERPVRAQPTVLVLDDNESLLELLSIRLIGESIAVVTASTAAQARELIAARRPDAALLDRYLPDGDGLALAIELRSTAPGLSTMLMTGMELSAEERAECERFALPVLRKPFLNDEAVNLIRSSLARASAAGGR